MFSKNTIINDKQPHRRTDFDVIVIGTGMGGSAAGAICARHGLKTLILEKNPRPGGSCSYYLKKGFHVDTGTHLFIRGNDGPFGECTRRLGMGEAINFLQADPVTHLRGFNLDIALPAGWAAKIIFLLRFVYQADIPMREYPSLIRMLWDMKHMAPAEIENLDRISIEDFMKRYTDNIQVLTVLGFLMGLYFVLPIWEASAGESIWNFQKMWDGKFTVCYPQGGAVTIPQTFLDGAKKHSATIRMSAPVKRIVVAEGRVSGVVLKNGEFISTRAVISTSAAKDTVLKLAGPEHFPNEYIDTIRNLTASMTAFQAKIGVSKKLVRAGSLVGVYPARLEGEITEALMRELYHEAMQGRSGAYVPVYIPVPTNFDPDLAPAGCQLITAVAGSPNLEVALEDHANIWMDKMMTALFRLIPGLEKNMIFCDRWSVRALANWIGKSSGAAISTAQNTDQTGSRRLGHETPVRGLYLAGDCAGPARGVGTELACQSGMDCADRVAERLHDRADGVSGLS